MKEQSDINCYYLGELYPIFTKIDPSLKKVTIIWNGKSFICSSPKEGKVDITDEIQKFYTKSGKKIIEERLKHYQDYFKVKYKSFSIENDATKWGSCSSKRHLTFHWKLMIFPIDIIDYVVVHELCHLIHMNHDRSFWRLVGKIYPDYKEAMAILGTTKTRDL